MGTWASGRAGPRSPVSGLGSASLAVPPSQPPISWLGMRPLCVVLVLGAVLLDLDQQTLPGVAHQVVEQMVISDQIKAEDRANVLRALLLKHR